MGFLADFLSRTVLVCFLSGVGVQVTVGELHGMLGIEKSGHGFLRQILFMPGMIMHWFGSDLFHANAPFFATQVRKLVDDSPTPVHWLVTVAPLPTWILVPVEL